MRSGWITSDLRAWVQDHLLAVGRLAVRDRQTIRLIEPGVGVAYLDAGVTPSPASARASTSAPVPALLAAARDRVVKTLRDSVESGQTSYVHAALYSGRVSRERGADGRSNWQVLLSEDVPLSDQVLSLFAADALMRPGDYENCLCVCSACGSVSFAMGSGSRQGCAIHPFGSVDNTKPPSSRSGARRITDRS